MTWGGTMVRVKEMPYSEKYAKVTDRIKFEETFIPPFVKKQLGLHLNKK